ncbi:MAG: 7,8-didemethyl-8-hydroxy-5-deazariboflavin synthase CofG [Candidatus Dadabacteria bacterium]|nr:7,8-didemethyl-8-hydroxy-5-deazariboflavin synthase CofG [Candidatus Dadabacteria bacterium]MDE0476550.1 7,8-didemethyl-8-hydroxy-5-deazariboflavin synthase CofG [Candidatus Dadabacteria bacterium]
MTLLAKTWEKTFGANESAMLLDTFGAGDFSELRASAKLERIISKAIEGESVTREDALYLAELFPREIPFLLLAASAVRNHSKGKTVTYSKNVFVPLTQLCRDRCGYCTFKIEPGEGELFMTPEEVVDMAKKGAQARCTELLFVTGDKPELAYQVYRDALGEIGYETTADYLIDMGKTGLEHGIFPHTNLGLSTPEELSGFRKSNPSMGLMLENISERLLRKGNAHHGCADKVPRLRMETMEYAGELNIPWTSGILVGIGETFEERIDSLYALLELSRGYGHLQEIIIQNFSPKEGIKMEERPPADFLEMLKTVAISRLIFGGNMNIQIPPNLNNRNFTFYLTAGINDLGGVSPLTIDYVNPEAPWPQVERMEREVNALGYELRERLPVYPEYIDERWIDPYVLGKVRERVDERGYVPVN